MNMRRAPPGTVMLAVLLGCGPALGWENGAARQPLMGWQNWNSLQNSFNATVVIELAHFMKDGGLLAAGYNFITLGGMGFAENGDPQAVPGFPKIPRQNITRNVTGYLQADASRFPGPGSTPACLDEQTVRVFVFVFVFELVFCAGNAAGALRIFHALFFFWVS
jgi:hypothetical protein